MPVYDHRYRGWTRRAPHRALPHLDGGALRARPTSGSRASRLLLFIVALLPPLFFGGMIYLANNVDMLAAVGSNVTGGASTRAGWRSTRSRSSGSWSGSRASPSSSRPSSARRWSRRTSRTTRCRSTFRARCRAPTTSLGKLLVLLLPLSAVTWIPGLLLVGLQTSLAGAGWLRRALAARAGDGRGLVDLDSAARACWRSRSRPGSSWRPVATGMLFGLFIVGEAFGKAIEEIAGFRWGKLLAMDDVVQTIWADLFGGIDFLGHEYPQDPLPVAACWADARRAPRRRALGAAPQGARLRGVAMSAHRRRGPSVSLRERLEVLRRGARGQPDRPRDRPRHHQPRRAERLRQDDADEPRDRPARGRPRGAVVGARHRAVRPGAPLRRGRLLHAVRHLSARHHAVGTSSTSTSSCTGSTRGRRGGARARRAIARVGMTDAASRRIAGYSKGMKQRIKLAQAIAHDPQVLLLDEPLNGLDPLARSEVIELLRSFAADGRTVVVSSHILHEVDELSDRVVLVHGGYIVAEGAIDGVRDEMAAERPLAGAGALRPARRCSRRGSSPRTMSSRRASIPTAAACWCGRESVRAVLSAAQPAGGRGPGRDRGGGARPTRTCSRSTST